MDNIVTKIVNKVGADKVMHVETCALIAVAVKKCTGSAVFSAAVAMIV